MEAILKDDGTAWAPSDIGRRRASRRLSRRVVNGMGNDGTEDRTAWADVQAIQLGMNSITGHPKNAV